jgi:hypothetical protein
VSGNVGIKRKKMNLQDFFTKNSLYEIVTPHDINDELRKILRVNSVLYGGTSIDMYCIECCMHSIFRRETVPYSGKTKNIAGNSVQNPDDGIYNIYAYCSRNEKHKATIILKKDGLSLIKIGQYPSLADILTPDLKKYAQIIGQERIKEWSRAIGLSAHGIGVGSFVYLRRILESLIEEAHILASQTENWDEQKYLKARQIEKMDLLDGYLPQYIIQNKNSYSILSKGVHELDEKTCIEYFPVLNSAIELIAEEKIAKLEIEKRKNDTQNALSQISKQISDSKNKK